MGSGESIDFISVGYAKDEVNTSNFIMRNGLGSSEEILTCTALMLNAMESGIKLEDNQLISFVSIDLEEHKKKYTNKSVKKTLSIPAWLNTLAEKENVNFSKILQSALKDYLKVKRKIQL